MALNRFGGWKRTKGTLEQKLYLRWKGWEEEGQLYLSHVLSWDLGYHM